MYLWKPVIYIKLWMQTGLTSLLWILIMWSRHTMNQTVMQLRFEIRPFDFVDLKLFETLDWAVWPVTKYSCSCFKGAKAHTQSISNSTSAGVQRLGYSMLHVIKVYLWQWIEYMVTQDVLSLYDSISWTLHFDLTHTENMCRVLPPSYSCDCERVAWMNLNPQDRKKREWHREKEQRGREAMGPLFGLFNPDTGSKCQPLSVIPDGILPATGRHSSHLCLNPCQSAGVHSQWKICKVDSCLFVSFILFATYIWGLSMAALVASLDFSLKAARDEQ